MEIAIAMSLFFVFVTVTFIAIAIFLPEWVGITGKKAKEIMIEQQGDPTTTPSDEALAQKTTEPHQK